MLRLDWNLLFNIINLMILYFLMKKFLFGPVNVILAKRQAEAEERFIQADEKETQARETRQRYETLLADAEGQRKQLVAEARQEASREYARMIEEAKLQADGIVEKARTDAENEKRVIMQQADSAVKELVVNAAAKMVGAAQDAESDKALYDCFLKKTEAPCGLES
ncbi:MAG: ATP synthase F0 subunit B [Lachnospiraceae bacterium]|nr:ATP synthase F0 subunit B [Lachnospiraceae bacterium]